METIYIIQPDEAYIGHLLRSRLTEEEIRVMVKTDMSVFEDFDQEPLVELEKTIADILERKKRFEKRYQMTVELKGEGSTRRVWLFGKELQLEPSLQLRNHSPTGFSWSYSGSGCAQLALAICLELMGKDKALNVYQEFKEKYIAPLPQGDFCRDIMIDV